MALASRRSIDSLGGLEMPLDTRISLYKLEVFCHVVELGGVGRAADHLYIAQPVVSAHLRSLQERLGATLLVRRGRQMELTEAGEAVYRWATETLTRGRELSRELEGIADGTAGVAVVAASMSLGSYVLPAILADFRTARPGSTVSLEVTDPERVLESVYSGAADFGVLVSDGPPDAAHFTVSELGHEGLVLFGPPEGPPTASQVSPEEFARLPFVTTPRSHVRRALVDAVLAEAGVRPGPVTIELGHPEAIKRAVTRGLGVAILFRQSVLDELRSGALREITIEGTKLRTPVFMVLRRGKRLSALQRELQTTIDAGVQAQLSADGVTGT